MSFLLLVFTISLDAQSVVEDVKNDEKEELTSKINYGSFTDSRDQKEYKTVMIGKQQWMAENVAYLPKVNTIKTISTAWPVYYVYGYKGTDVKEAKLTENYKLYGVLYNWVAAQSACPAGWHLPSNKEWEILFNTIGYASNAGNSMKEAGVKHWKRNTKLVTNSSGFTALPAGSIIHENGWDNLGIKTNFWGSDARDADRIDTKSLSDYSAWAAGTQSLKTSGLSVRCIKN